MKEILSNVMAEVLIAAIVVLGGAMVALIKAKISDIAISSKDTLTKKIWAEASDAIEGAVAAVNQTFVDELKGKNLFDKEAQTEAFERALDGTIAALSQEAIDFINNTYGDVEIWLTDKIEAAVRKNKK